MQLVICRFSRYLINMDTNAKCFICDTVAAVYCYVCQQLYCATCIERHQLNMSVTSVIESQQNTAISNMLCDDKDAWFPLVGINKDLISCRFCRMIVSLDDVCEHNAHKKASETTQTIST